ncbi:hypothetical protein [Crocosphaera sp.]|uniref:hypothetical protein n=1 Tax=Crocosphaera sp. TaxID=2729996 RepID=UPI003F2704D9|nr:hypothetical protein [Crocosphaera sp.]
MTSWLKKIIQVIIIALLWTILINPGDLNGDTILRWKMTQSFWTNAQEVAVDPNYKPQDRELGLGVVGKDGTRRIAYDSGQSLLMLPGDWLGTKIRPLFPKMASSGEPYLVQWLTINLLIFVPLNVALAVSCFWLIRSFGFNNNIASLSSIGWFLGTTVLHYAQLHQQNNQILLFVILGYSSIMNFMQSKKDGFLTLSGLSLGIAFLIRFTSIIHGFTAFIFLLGCLFYEKYNLRKVLTSSLLWIVGFLPVAFLAKYIDYLRFGFWSFKSGYAVAAQMGSDAIYAHLPPRPPGFPFINPPHVGIIGVLLSLEKSIFIYDPLLLPCIILGIIFWKKISPYIQLYLISCIFNLTLHIALTSKLFFWHGDGAWGARYHVTSVHLLLIPLTAILIDNILSNKGWKKWGLKTILAGAIVVQIASISLMYHTETSDKFRLGKRFENILCLGQASPETSSFCQYSPQFQRNLSQKISPLPFNYARFRLNRKLIFMVWGLALITAMITTTFWFVLEL